MPQTGYLSIVKYGRTAHQQNPFQAMLNDS